MHLKNLVQLWINDNMLATLPQEIGALAKLETLVAGHNMLERLPPQIGMLQALETLWVGNNRLTALPLELADLRSLSILGIKNNPLNYVPDAVRQMAAYKVRPTVFCFLIHAHGDCLGRFVLKRFTFLLYVLNSFCFGM
jgi:Leucine-rich repeat (LRR) protein